MAFLLALPVTAEAQSLPSASEWLPPEALVVLELHRPKVLLDELAGEELQRAIALLPLYRQQQSQPKFREFVGVIRFLEASLGTDWRTGLSQLTGGGVTVAICPKETVVAIIDSDDEQMLARLHEILLSIARAEAQKQGRPEQVGSREYGGATAWTFGGGEAHTIIGKRLVLANRAEALKEVLDRRASPARRSLADDESFQVYRRSTEALAPTTLYVNLQPLIGLPPVKQVLERQQRNPLAVLAFAGISESIRRSNWLALGLNVEGMTVTIQAMADGDVSGKKSVAAFSLPQEGHDGAWPNLAVPRRVAALSLYRDLHSFYAAKDTLFPERTSGLIFFENMMGIFFTGRDLTSEVLAEFEPQIRIVLAEQRYDPNIGTPKTKLPAFAVVLRFRRPEQFRSVVEEAWQKAVGLINFTRGQQALPGLIIDRPQHGPTKFTVAHFSTADVEDRTNLDTRFNARPALAMPGEYLILSSTDGLARDLIDALACQSDREGASSAQTHSMLEFDGAQAAHILKANQETLIRQDMVKKGKTYEQAEAGIAMLIDLIECVEQVQLQVGTGQGLTQHLDLQIKLKPPDHEPQ